MKRWKIFHESDKQLNADSRQGKNVVQAEVCGQSKIHRKEYTPLRRSKAQSTGQVTTNKNVTVSQTFLPSYNLRYLKSQETDSNQGNKVKTQYIDELSFKNEYNPQKSFIQQGNQRLRERKTNSKSSNEIFSKLLNNNSTDINYRVGMAEVINTGKKNSSMPISFRKKSLTSNQKAKELKKKIKTLQKEQKNLKDEVKHQLTKLNEETQKDRNRWQQLVIKMEQKEKKNMQGELISKIFKDYSQYRAKIDNLEQQKQVFLQALIRINPV